MAHESKFEQISVSKASGTRGKLRELAALLTLKAGGHRVTLSEAADRAVSEAIERHKPKGKGRKR